MYISSYSNDISNQTKGTLDELLKHTLCAFVRSQVLFAAIRLNLFNMIEESSDRSLSYEEMRKSSISLSMLSYLIYLRLLKRCSKTNRYECTSVTRKFLIPSAHNYVGLGIGVWDHRRQYTFFLRLSETVKYGARMSEESDEKSCLWTIFEQKHDPMIYFAKTMSSFTRCTINNLCDHVDFAIYSTLLDVGGSLGDLSRTVVQRYPHMRAFSLDLPELTAYASTLNLNGDNIQHIAGNFFEETWPKDVMENVKVIDLISLKYILHDWPYVQRAFLIKKIYQLLKTKVQISGGNGTILVIEKMIDQERQNVTTLSTSISMAVECGDGIGYDATKDEYEQLFLQAGFQHVQSVQLIGPMVALFAHIM